MAVKQILLLGNDKLTKQSQVVEENELEFVRSIVPDLHDTIWMEF